MPVDRHSRIATPPPSSPYTETPRRSARLQASLSTPVGQLAPLQNRAAVGTPTPLRRSAVVYTYAGPRTIASSSGSSSPEVTPARHARIGTRAASLTPSAPSYTPPSQVDTTPSEVFPTILEILQRTDKQEPVEGGPGDKADDAAPTNEEGASTAVGPPSAEATVLKALVSLVEASGKCDGCWSFMGRDCYVLRECGHSYCALCLRRTFEAKLADTLETMLDHGYHFAHHEDECHAIPRSDFQQARLIECLGWHTISPKSVFKYRCPLCRAAIVKEPVLDRRLSDLLGTMGEMLEERLDTTKEEWHVEFPKSPFEGLFLSDK